MQAESCVLLGQHNQLSQSRVIIKGIPNGSHRNLQCIAGRRNKESLVLPFDDIHPIYLEFFQEARSVALTRWKDMSEDALLLSNLAMKLLQSAHTTHNPRWFWLVRLFFR